MPVCRPSPRSAGFVTRAHQGQSALTPASSSGTIRNAASESPERVVSVAGRGVASRYRQVAEYRPVSGTAQVASPGSEPARTASGRLVALTPPVRPRRRPGFPKRFRRETLAARAVAGPFTAAVLDADPDAVRPWLATEFCAGPTLAETADALGPLGAGPLAALGAALAEALAGIHRAGLVHRDLKPSNVVLTRGGAEGAWTRHRPPGGRRGR
ncbi:hypothetical protein SMICM17S_00099 [Streptomyces microflavus]